MRYKIIGTGSSGNALLLEDTILLDCGVSYKKLKDEHFELVLLTHRHGDHLNKSTVKKIAAEHPMMRFGCSGYLVDTLIQCGVEKKNIDVYEHNLMYEYRGTILRIIDLVHDVPNIGYWLMINGCETVLYMTDTGTADHVDENGLDYYFIEANYKEEELKERIKEKLDAGEFAYETRVADTHLSEEQAIKFIAEHARPDSKVIYMHKHVDKTGCNADRGVR